MIISTTILNLLMAAIIYIHLVPNNFRLIIYHIQCVHKVPSVIWKIERANKLS
jgi:hypothetical protein